MRCDFCGEEIEGQPFFKDGMSFCSSECMDALEGGETLPMDEEVLDDPDEFEEEDAADEEEDVDDVDDEDEDDEDLDYEDDYEENDAYEDEREY